MLNARLTNTALYATPPFTGISAISLSTPGSHTARSIDHAGSPGGRTSSRSSQRGRSQKTDFRALQSRRSHYSALFTFTFFATPPTSSSTTAPPLTRPLALASLGLREARRQVGGARRRTCSGRGRGREKARARDAFLNGHVRPGSTHLIRLRLLLGAAGRGLIGHGRQRLGRGVREGKCRVRHRSLTVAKPV